MLLLLNKYIINIQAKAVTTRRNKEECATKRRPGWTQITEPVYGWRRLHKLRHLLLLGNPIAVIYILILTGIVTARVGCVYLCTVLVCPMERKCLKPNTHGIPMSATMSWQCLGVIDEIVRLRADLTDGGGSVHIVPHNHEQMTRLMTTSQPV